MSKNANYTSEFKREAVKLSQSAGKPISQMAMELGVKPNTLYNWISNSISRYFNVFAGESNPHGTKVFNA